MRSPKYFEKNMDFLKERYTYYTNIGWMKELSLSFAIMDLNKEVEKSIDSKVELDLNKNKNN